MPKVAEAECATCHHILPKSEMREVAVSRVVGRSSSSGQSSNSGNRHSSSFNSRGQWRSGNSNSSGTGTVSRSSTRTRVERVWVCRTCKAPKSDGWFLGLVVKLALVAVVIYFVAGYLLSSAKQIPSITWPSSVTGKSITSVPRKSVRGGESLTRESPKITFGPRREVAQPTETTSANYPPCSSTVTDHCIGK